MTTVAPSAPSTSAESRSCRRESSFGISDRSSIGGPSRSCSSPTRPRGATSQPMPWSRRGASCDTVAFVEGRDKLEGAVAVGTQRKSVDLLRLGPGSMLGDVEIAEGLTHFLAIGDDDSAEHVARGPAIVF